MSTGYHEDTNKLSKDAINMHRALASLMEELEAVDWYQQRADVCDDKELKEILIHNMNEEVEHAAMALEWIRRKYEIFDKELRDNLFKDGPIGHH